MVKSRLTSWKFILLLILLVMLTLGSARLLFTSLDDSYRGSTRWVRKRLQLALDQLDHLPAKNDKLIMVIGASDVETGFDPESFDTEMAQIGIKSTSYNLGFRNFDPELLHLMSRRLREALSRQNQIADIIFVKFTPLRATLAYSKSLANRIFTHIDDCETAIYSPAMMYEDAQLNPSKILQVWASKDLFAGISPPSAQASLLGLYYKSVPWGVGLDQALVTLTTTWDELWKNPDLNPEIAWDQASRGSFFFGYPNNKDYAHSLISKISSLEIQKAMLDRFASSSDAYYLHFDPRLLVEFSMALKELSSVAKKVVILDWPDSEKIGRPREAMLRRAKAVNEIHQTSGDPVIDLGQFQQLNSSDFFDLFHLNLEGREKLSRLLARSIANEHLLDSSLVSRE